MARRYGQACHAGRASWVHAGVIAGPHDPAFILWLPLSTRHRAVWMYLRFTLSFRDVEELLAGCGITVSHESIRRWVLSFGPVIAPMLQARRPKPHGRWHLDEMAVRIGGRRMYLSRALMPKARSWTCSFRPKRDTKAARKLMRKLLKRQG